MQGLFSPAVALLATLRFPAKFTLIALTILIPMGMLGFNIVSTQQKNTTFLQNQLKGIEYLEAIRPAIEYLPQHRGMYNAFRNGKTQLADKIQQRRQQVDKVLAEIDQINQRIGTELGLSSKFTPIKTHWESLKGSIDQQPPAKAFEDHTALIYELIGFILEVADQSGLILDPELDSYYMMDSTVTKLPAVTELLGRARGFASGLAAKGQATAKERAALTMQLELINQNVRALEHAMVVIYETAPHLKADFDSLAGPVFTASKEYIGYLTSNILNSDAISVDAKVVFDKGTQDITLAFKLYDSMLPALQNIYQQRHDDSINQEALAIGMISAAVILVTYLFGGLYFSIMRNIEALNTAADHVADGDLTQQITLNTRDEMGQISEAMNSMVDSFRKLAGDVKASSCNLSEASNSLANISAEANQSMQAQWSQIDQVATAVNEMSATVADVSHHAAETANATTHVREQTESGKQVVGQAVQAVQALANEVQQTAGVIHKLEEDSENIGTVLDVIRGIAEQTNLLALNAAIEAARAGEQGRGFAVVADEVRTLAGRTQQSTEEIQEMIIALQSGANNAVKVMERGQSQVQVSVDQAARAQESLNAITDAVNNIADMSAQIATAAEEQSATTEEINRNVVSISEMAGKTADGAQQVANTTDQLAGLASQLQNQTQAFKV